MMIRAFTAAALLWCGAACALDPRQDDQDTITAPTHKPAANPAESLPDDEAETDLLARAACDVALGDVPEDSPCYLACDPEALLEAYVPEGMCVLIECAYRDGSPLRVGGCNL